MHTPTWTCMSTSTHTHRNRKKPTHSTHIYTHTHTQWDTNTTHEHNTIQHTHPSKLSDSPLLSITVRVWLWRRAIPRASLVGPHAAAVPQCTAGLATQAQPADKNNTILPSSGKFTQIFLSGHNLRPVAVRIVGLEVDWRHIWTPWVNNGFVAVLELVGAFFHALTMLLRNELD